MNIIAPLLEFLQFMDFEAKIMSVFSREINVNIREKGVNTRPSRHKCEFFAQVNIRSQNERKPKENCNEQKKC